jgi:hypothetical protein
MSYNYTMDMALQDGKRRQFLQELNLSFDAHFLPSFPRKRDIQYTDYDWEHLITMYGRDYLWVINDNNTLTFMSAPTHILKCSQ